MNYFLITVLVAIASSSYGANIMSTSKHEIMLSLHDKCQKNAQDPIAFRELEMAIQPMEECIESALGNNSTSNDLNRYNTFCELAENSNYYKCLENFADKVRPCLDAYEEYLPDFVLTVIMASFAEICEDGRNRININTVLNDIGKTTCFRTNRDIETIKGKCIDKLVVYNISEHDISTTNKENLCSDLLSLKKCIIDHLQESCNEDHSDIISLFGNPFLTTC